MLRRKNNERGSTLVEFAIGVTVFVMAMFAVLEFGRALWIHNALSDAARRGARYAVLNTAGSADQVKNIVVYGNAAGTGQPMLNDLTTANVNVTYNAYRDAFAKATQDKSAFGPALGTMRQATIADMRKSGFTVAGP